MDDLLAKRLRLDRHVPERPGHGVDDRGVRTRHVDDDGRTHRNSTVEGDAGHPAVGGENVHDLPAKEKLAALRLRRTLQVPGRELRIGDVAAVRPKDCTLDLAPARFAKAFVVHGPRRPEATQVIEGEPLPDRRPVPFLVRYFQLLRKPEVLLEVPVVIGLHHDAATVDELRQLTLIVGLEVPRPVLPVVVPLPGEGDTVERRVVDPDDRARIRGRPVTGRRVPVHIQGSVAELGELVGGCSADDASANDDGIVLVPHGLSPTREGRIIPDLVPGSAEKDLRQPTGRQPRSSPHTLRVPRTSSFIGRRTQTPVGGRRPPLGKSRRGSAPRHRRW